MSFESEFRRAREAVIAASKEVVKVAAFDAFNTAIVISPVGNPDLWVTKDSNGNYVDYIAYKGYPDGYVGGRFRSNWNLSFSGFDVSTTDSAVSKQAKKGQLQEVFTAPYTGYYAYTNSLPYAQRIDNGWSSQAPTGITEVVKLRTERKVPKFTKAAFKRYGVTD